MGKPKPHIAVEVVIALLFSVVTRVPLMLEKYVQEPTPSLCVCSNTKPLQSLICSRHLVAQSWQTRTPPSVRISLPRNVSPSATIRSAPHCDPPPHGRGTNYGDAGSTPGVGDGTEGVENLDKISAFDTAVNPASGRLPVMLEKYVHVPCSPLTW